MNYSRLCQHIFLAICHVVTPACVSRYLCVKASFLDFRGYFYVYLFCLNFCSASDDSEHVSYCLRIVTRLIVASCTPQSLSLSLFFFFFFVSLFAKSVFICAHHSTCEHCILYYPQSMHINKIHFFPIGNQNSWACLLLVHGLAEL